MRTFLYIVIFIALIAAGFFGFLLLRDRILVSQDSETQNTENSQSTDNNGKSQTTNESDTVLVTISKNEDNSEFSNLTTQSEVENILKQDKKFTVFVPENSVLQNNQQIEALKQDENKADLVKFMNNHIVEGIYKPEDFVEKTTLTSLSGKELEVELINGAVYVDGILVTSISEETDNGIVYTISGYFED